MTVDLDALERTAKAATRGRWQWFGNTKMHEVYLATVDRGRVFVMDFVRWGMRGAQPRFQVMIDGPGTGIMRTLGGLGDEEHPFGPKFEASHRRQFTGIGHPDAEHIAANNPDVTLELIARIRDLEEACRTGSTDLDDAYGADYRSEQAIERTQNALKAAVARGTP